MTQVLTKYARYLSDFRAFERSLPAHGPQWLREIRQRALARFEEVGFPTTRRGNEEWKYTHVLPIANSTFEYPFDVNPPNPLRPQVDPDLSGDKVGPLQRGARGDLPFLKVTDLRQLTPWNDSWVNLVFVDGHYVEALSTAPGDSPTVPPSQGGTVGGARVTNLAEAVREDQEVVEQHLARYATFENDGFTAVNTAFLNDGAFVHVTEDNPLHSTVHLIFLSTDRGRPTVSHPRTLVVAGSNTKLTIVESYIGLSSAPYFTNAVAEIVVGDGAKIEHYGYLMESPQAFHVGITRVRQGRDSTFSSTSFAMGADVARNDLHVFLDAPGSSCYLRGLYLTSGTQHIDNHISIDHIKPHTTSRQYYKGILAGKSKAVYSGRVLVHQGAQKTDAHQADKNLILSEGAEVDTKPSLEIYADDVKCGHGATAGQVAQDALFYLRSRGLDLETATTLLIRGFASEIIDAIQLEPYRDYLDQLFSRSLPSFQVGGTP